MINIFDFGWKMQINFEFICEAIQSGSLRSLHYKFCNMRKLYRLIIKYGDSLALKQMEHYLSIYPKARQFFVEGKRL